MLLQHRKRPTVDERVVNHCEQSAESTRPPATRTPGPSVFVCSHQFCLCSSVSVSRSASFGAQGTTSRKSPSGIFDGERTGHPI